jgi:hypothetical protein
LRKVRGERWEVMERDLRGGERKGVRVGKCSSLGVLLTSRGRKGRSEIREELSTHLNTPLKMVK